MIRICLLVLMLTQLTTVYSQKTVRFADSLRNYYHIPELSYAVIDYAKTIEIAALGHHSIALPDTATLQDRFHIGSNTKAMTAFIIAKYVESGKLKWTTKFYEIYPEWKKAGKEVYKDINLQDLLSHRAGIQPFQGENDPVIPDFTGTNQGKRRQFGKFVLTLDPVKPDTTNPFIYSNAGYTLATLMVEKASGKSWEELVDLVFNKDLKLNVQLSWPENQKRKDTWGHSTDSNQLKPVPSTFDYQLDYTEPAGDINITLKDYIKFIQLNLQGLKGQSNYLKSTTYHFLHKGVEHYSMGWFNIAENNQEFSTHSGTGAFTYYTIAQIDRVNKMAYIIFTNCYNDETHQGVGLLMRKLKENHNTK